MKKGDAILNALYCSAISAFGISVFPVVDVWFKYPVLLLSLFPVFLEIYKAIWRLENKE